MIKTIIKELNSRNENKFKKIFCHTLKIKGKNDFSISLNRTFIPLLPCSKDYHRKWSVEAVSVEDGRSLMTEPVEP